MCLSKQCEATRVYKDIRSKCTSLYDLNAMHGKNFFIDSCSVLFSSTVELRITYVRVSNECYNLFNMQSLSYKRYTLLPYTYLSFHALHMHISYIDFQYIPVWPSGVCLPACWLADLSASMHACMHARILKGSSLFHGIHFPFLHLLCPHIDFSHSTVQCALCNCFFTLSLFVRFQLLLFCTMCLFLSS